MGFWKRTEEEKEADRILILSIGLGIPFLFAALSLTYIVPWVIVWLIN
jgi:hypothetical protein